MTEDEKMHKGLWYDANNNPELLKQRDDAKDLCQDYNLLRQSDHESREKLMKHLLGSLGKNSIILSPFECDYGYNIQMGADCFVNSTCYFMDCATITLGHHVYMGPSCGLYTAVHPLPYQLRNSGIEKALPITIGNNVWMGGNVVVLPGVTIGDGAVIGAGSVVTKDIPSHVVAAGNPCHVMKEIDQDVHES